MEKPIAELAAEVERLLSNSREPEDNAYILAAAPRLAAAWREAQFRLAEQRINCVWCGATFQQCETHLSTMNMMADHMLVCKKHPYPELHAKAEQLREALKLLYEETADYIRINNLGDVHHNHSMQMARAALAQSEKEESHG